LDKPVVKIIENITYDYNGNMIKVKKYAPEPDLNIGIKIRDLVLEDSDDIKNPIK
jgi:hypothetical protein